MMLKHRLYLINMRFLSHEHENDDDKIYALIWRCVHVVVLPCLLFFVVEYVFQSPGHIQYTNYLISYHATVVSTCSIIMIIMCDNHLNQTLESLG